MNLANIFHSFYNKVYSFTLLRVGNVHDAEDIASDVFVRVAEKLDTYNPEKAAFSTWLFTIALNEIRMYFRARKTGAAPEELEKLADSLDIEEDLLRREEYVLLYKAIDKLNDNQKDAVLLKYFGDLTNIKIAEVLDISESSVGVTLHRAKNILKKSLISCKESDASAYKSTREEEAAR